MEYVALVVIELSTKEGPAFIFLAYDPFRDVIFNQQMELNDSPQSALNSLYFLVEDPMFHTGSNEAFTLVLDKYEEISQNMQRVLDPLKRKLLFAPPFKIT